VVGALLYQLVGAPEETDEPAPVTDNI
jgi:hypothetical protein